MTASGSKKTKTIFLSLTFAAAALLCGCAGHQNARTRLSMLSAEDQLPEDVRAEIKVGREVAARLLGLYGLYENDKLERYVGLVGNALAYNSSRTEIDYHFAILDTDEINAFAAPGGYVFVTRGAIENMRDEAELAGVLAHEIAHITQCHIVKELNVKGREKGAQAGFARLLGGAGDAARAALDMSVDAAMKILFDRGYKIEDELEADRTAVLLLASVGYDVGALERFLTRTQNKSDETSVNKRNKTHPTSERRMADLRKASKEAGLGSEQFVEMKYRFQSYATAP